MIALTDAELEQVMTAAKPLAPKDRDPFLRDVAAELAEHPALGPGIVGRVVRDVQRSYFDPPNLSGASKYA